MVSIRELIKKYLKKPDQLDCSNVLIYEFFDSVPKSSDFYIF